MDDRAMGRRKATLGAETRAVLVLPEPPPFSGDSKMPMPEERGVEAEEEEGADVLGIFFGGGRPSGGVAVTAAVTAAGTVVTAAETDLTAAGTVRGDEAKR